MTIRAAPTSSASSPPRGRPTPASSTTWPAWPTSPPSTPLWFHIDGAYGGAAALFAPSVRARFAGFERADSFIVDPHKWLFAPFDCAALLYRQPNLAKAVHAQDAQYLEVLHSENPEDGTRATTPSTSHAAPAACRCGSPWRSTASTPTARASRRGWPWPNGRPRGSSESPHVELVRDPGLSIVLFRRPGWEQGRLRGLVGRACSTTQIGFVTPTTWEGETVARFAFLHPNTTLEMVDEILDSMVDA